MRAFVFALLTGLILVAGLGCTESGSEDAASSASQDTTLIPFDKEGRLAFLQNRDTVAVLDIEVTDSDSARERGMMQRDGFPSDTSGMLFPFPKEEERTFWMANTPVPLDLFFINADSQVVHIAKYAQPNSADPISSGDPAQYVLETPAGFADSYGVVEGDRVRWRRTDE